MAELTLQQYLEGPPERSQADAAALIGCTPGAISQILALGRDVRLIFDSRGRYIDHYEITRLRVQGDDPRRRRKRAG